MLKIAPLSEVIERTKGSNAKTAAKRRRQSSLKKRRSKRKWLESNSQSVSHKGYVPNILKRMIDEIVKKA